MHDAYLFSQKDQIKTIRVNGKAKIAVEPDTVIVRMDVHTEALSLTQAQQENAQRMEKVIHSLLNLGIRQEDMQTTAFTIQPMYDYVENKQVFRGFEVKNELTVSFDEAEAAGKIVDTAVEHGINHVSEIRFSTENHTYFYKQAVIMALEDAVSIAFAMAEKMQLQLDPYPIKIDEISNKPQMQGQTFSLAYKDTTPIEPGRIVISAGVQVVFQYN